MTSYNLLAEPWIPVVFHGGAYKQIGIIELLERCKLVSHIAIDHALDRIAILRYVVSILQDAKPSLDEKDTMTLGAHPEGIPLEWLEKLGSSSNPNPLYDMYRGHLQDIGMVAKESKSPAYLRIDMASGTNIDHRGYNRGDSLCMRCCAIGIMRTSYVESAMVRGFPSAINGNKQAYMVKVGSSIYDTLTSMWPLPAVNGDAPMWDVSIKSSKRCNGPCAYLTWRPRRILLHDPDESINDCCARCGSNRHVVSSIYYEPGDVSPFGGKSIWRDDPNLLLSSDGKQIAWPDVKDDMDAHCGTWRRVMDALLHRAQPGTYEVTLLASSQCLYKHAYSFTVTIPILSDEQLSCIQSELEWMQTWVRDLKKAMRAQSRLFRSLALQHAQIVENALWEAFQELLCNPGSTERWRQSVRATMALLVCELAICRTSTLDTLIARQDRERIVDFQKGEKP